MNRTTSIIAPMRIASWLIISLLFLAFAASQARAGVVRVYLLGGQSNADGRAPSSDLPVSLQQPQSDVAYFFHIEGAGNALDSTLTTLRPSTSESGAYFGPEVAFGRAMADHYADDPATTTVAVIKYANGGKNLYSAWRGGGDATITGDGSEYKIFQQTVSAGIQALQEAYPLDDIEIAGMIWMHGESDALNSTYAYAYQNRLSDFIADIRATYGEELPFVIGRLSIGQTALPETELSIVRAAQTAVAEADPLVGLVDTDSFAIKSDNMHFDAAGQLALGAAFASAMLTTHVPEPSAFMLLGLGAGVVAPLAIRKARRRKTSVSP